MGLLSRPQAAPKCRLCQNPLGEDEVFCDLHRALQMAELAAAEAYWRGFAEGAGFAAEKVRGLAGRHMSQVPRPTLVRESREIEKAAAEKAKANRPEPTHE